MHKFVSYKKKETEVNLNGALSKFIPPGDKANINPKSICKIYPFESIKIFPLCL